MKKIIFLFCLFFQTQSVFCAAIAAGGLHSMPQDSAFGVLGQFLGGQEKFDDTDTIDQLSAQEDITLDELDRAFQVDILLRRALQASQELLEYLEWHTPEPYSEKDFSEDDVLYLLDQARDESAALGA